VLVLVADDQRFDTVGALGNDRIDTPNLDRLVQSGTAFTRAHNMGADQGAVCVPARAMLMSGRHLFNLDGPGDVTESHTPLPRQFAEAGYRTFGTGKWHNGTEAFNRCFDEGRNVFFGGMGNHWNVPVTDRRPDGEYPEPVPHRTDWNTGQVMPQRQVAQHYAAGTHSSELFADTTVEFVEKASGGDRPFFAYVATMAPHDPRSAPGEYLSRYDHGALSLPESFLPEHPFDNGSLGVRDERLAALPRDSEEVRRHIADYYAMISHLDAQVGRVLDALEERGERENTLVVFTADHGLAVGRHGLMGKQNLYDHSVRVPLLFSGPGVPAGERRDALSCHFDLYPTLCDLADLDAEVPETVDGESLAPVVTEGTAPPRERVLCAYENTQRALRGDRYKLVEYLVDGERHTQLFDLEADPAETENLAGEPARADDRSRLRRAMRERQTAMGDPLLADADWDVGRDGA
jgi:arylsulfatase A-like enzyme